jgi:hypothetical protein
MTGEPADLKPFSRALQAVVDQLFVTGLPTVRATTDPRPRDGFITHESYLVVPSLQRARFMLPLISRAARRSAVLSYNQLRSPGTRLARRLLAAGLVAAAGPPLGERLHIQVKAAPEQTPRDQLLSAHLADLVGTRPLGLAVGIREPGPNSKPTVLCIDRAGAPVAFAKVGWNELTGELVTNEASALRLVASSPGSDFAVPELLHGGQWQGRQLCVTAPMARDMRKWTDQDSAPAISTTQAVAAVGTRTTNPLRDSEQIHRLRRVAQAPDWDADVRRAFTLLLDRIIDTAGTDVLHFGAWHGDWAPWNTGLDGGVVTAWDWEHFHHDVAVGLDVVNWHFRVALNLIALPVRAALEQAMTRSRPALAEVSGHPGFSKVLTALLALELTARYEIMAARGVGRSLPLHTGLVEALNDVGDRWLPAATA